MTSCANFADTRSTVIRPPGRGSVLYMWNTMELATKMGVIATELMVQIINLQTEK